MRSGCQMSGRLKLFTIPEDLLNTIIVFILATGFSNLKAQDGIRQHNLAKCTSSGLEGHPYYLQLKSGKQVCLLAAGSSILQIEAVKLEIYFKILNKIKQEY